jgi:monoamine oxidase
MKMNCIVIGAGASGLMASGELVSAGYPLTLLEARTRVGGRIYTITEGNFSSSVEGGAEFVHGDVPLTMALLREANIAVDAMTGETYQIDNGEIRKEDFFGKEWDKLLRELKKLKQDLTMDRFLYSTFPGNAHAHLRAQVKAFVEGYNAADLRDASALALRDEWLQEDDPIQYRPRGGYGRLVDFLIQRIAGKADVRLSEVVTHIDWNPGQVSVKTNKQVYTAAKAVITVPIHALHNIRFTPSLPTYLQAADDIGFGPVVKLLFEFNSRFWEKASPRKMPSLKFLFTDAAIPTWWSQLPDSRPLLTGWLGGPAVKKLQQNKDHYFQLGVNSLAHCFQTSADHITGLLRAWHIEDWSRDPLCPGAYSYAKPETAAARRILNTPVAQTLFFAGEALDQSLHTGTVEAALSSGKYVAAKIIDASR